tara:strand:+ start:638 stop:1207 length:570 start_codon:yes stop_codon:yes gene_type:complete
MNLKKGAMFGVDARVALAVFAILSIVVIANIYRVLTEINVDKVLAETTVIGTAVDDFHKDMNRSIFDSLNSGLSSDDTQTQSFMALTKSNYVASGYRSKWDGPYLKLNYIDANEPFLGTKYRLIRLAKDTGPTCNNTNTNPCYVFLLFRSMTDELCDAFEEQTSVEGYGKVYRSGGATCDILINLTIDY